MKFGNIHLIYLLWLILPIIIFYYWVFSQRRKSLQKFADKELLKSLISSFSLKKKKFKAFLIILAFLLAIISLLRPQWGVRWEKVRRKGLDILIAVDTSKSMLAEDVKPNRLERTKLAIKDLVKNLKTDRIGLIAFAGTAFLQCPLTIDYNGFLISLNNIDVNTIPREGTAISSALKEAIKSFKSTEKKYRVLILITDGEDHEGNPLEMTEELKKENIKTFCIGIGSKEGDLISVLDQIGNRVFLKDNEGNIVKTCLNETILQKIALTTGGSYIKATGKEFGLELIYKEKLSKMEKKELESKMQKHYEERFQISLILAILLLLLEPLIFEKKRIK